MLSASLKMIKALLTLLGVLAILLIGVRAYDSQRGPPLEVWHKYAPTEMSAEEIDIADWPQYLAAEEKVLSAAGGVLGDPEASLEVKAAAAELLVSSGKLEFVGGSCDGDADRVDAGGGADGGGAA